jgi:hypothetical protein
MTLGRQLYDLGEATARLEGLYEPLNRLIAELGGTTSIRVSDIAICQTLQDVFDLVEDYLPNK